MEERKVEIKRPLQRAVIIANMIADTIDESERLDVYNTCLVQQKLAGILSKEDSAEADRIVMENNQTIRKNNELLPFLQGVLNAEIAKHKASQGEAA